MLGRNSISGDEEIITPVSAVRDSIKKTKEYLEKEETGSYVPSDEDILRHEDELERLRTEELKKINL
jgi:hypothetical protein